MDEKLDLLGSVLTGTTFNDIVQGGVDNYDLSPFEFYTSKEKVKQLPKYKKQDGTFDQDLFKKDYDNLKKQFEEVKSKENVIKEAINLSDLGTWKINPSSTANVYGLDSRKNWFYTAKLTDAEKKAKAVGSKIGFNGLISSSSPTKSIEEASWETGIKQLDGSYKPMSIWDMINNSFEKNPKVPVYAFELDPTTNKSKPKFDENGRPYLEWVDATKAKRNDVNVASIWDNFELAKGHQLDNSSLTETPQFITGAALGTAIDLVQGITGLVNAGTELLTYGTKAATGLDFTDNAVSKTINRVNNTLDLYRVSTSAYGKENALTSWEGLTTNLSNVVFQLLSGGVTAKGAFMATNGITRGLMGLGNTSKDDIFNAVVRNFEKRGGGTSAQMLGEIRDTFRKTNLDEQRALDIANNVASFSNKLTLTAMASKDILQEAKDNGLDPLEAVGVYGATFGALWAVNGLSDWFTKGLTPKILYPELKKSINTTGKALFEDVLTAKNIAVEMGTKEAAEEVKKRSFMAGLAIAKDFANSVKTNIGKLTEASKASTFKSYVSAAALESAEESMEVIAEEGIKQAYNLADYWYGNYDKEGKGRFRDVTSKDWTKDFLSNIGTSAVFGGLGGIVGKKLFNTGNKKEIDSPDRDFNLLDYYMKKQSEAVDNGLTEYNDEYLSQIDQMTKDGSILGAEAKNLSTVWNPAQNRFYTVEEIKNAANTPNAPKELLKAIPKSMNDIAGETLKKQAEMVKALVQSYYAPYNDPLKNRDHYLHKLMVDSEQSNSFVKELGKLIESNSSIYSESKNILKQIAQETNIIKQATITRNDDKADSNEDKALQNKAKEAEKNIEQLQKQLQEVLSGKNLHNNIAEALISINPIMNPNLETKSIYSDSKKYLQDINDYKYFKKGVREFLTDEFKKIEKDNKFKFKEDVLDQLDDLLTDELPKRKFISQNLIDNITNLSINDVSKTSKQYKELVENVTTENRNNLLAVFNNLPETIDVDEYGNSEEYDLQNYIDKGYYEQPADGVRIRKNIKDIDFTPTEEELKTALQNLLGKKRKALLDHITANNIGVVNPSTNLKEFIKANNNINDLFSGQTIQSSINSDLNSPKELLIDSFNSLLKSIPQTNELANLSTINVKQLSENELADLYENLRKSLTSLTAKDSEGLLIVQKSVDSLMNNLREKLSLLAGLRSVNPVVNTYLDKSNKLGFKPGLKTTENSKSLIETLEDQLKTETISLLDKAKLQDLKANNYKLYDIMNNYYTDEEIARYQSLLNNSIRTPEQEAFIKEYETIQQEAVQQMQDWSMQSDQMLPLLSIIKQIAQNLSNPDNQKQTQKTREFQTRLVQTSMLIDYTVNPNSSSESLQTALLDILDENNFKQMSIDFTITDKDKEIYRNLYTILKEASVKEIFTILKDKEKRLEALSNIELFNEFLGESVILESNIFNQYKTLSNDAKLLLQALVKNKFNLIKQQDEFSTDLKESLTKASTRKESYTYLSRPYDLLNSNILANDELPVDSESMFNYIMSIFSLDSIEFYNNYSNLLDPNSELEWKDKSLLIDQEVNVKEVVSALLPDKNIYNEGNIALIDNYEIVYTSQGTFKKRLKEIDSAKGNNLLQRISLNHLYFFGGAGGTGKSASIYAIMRIVKSITNKSALVISNTDTQIKNLNNSNNAQVLVNNDSEFYKFKELAGLTEISDNQLVMDTLLKYGYTYVQLAKEAITNLKLNNTALSEKDEETIKDYINANYINKNTIVNDISINRSNYEIMRSAYTLLKDKIGMLIYDEATFKPSANYKDSDGTFRLGLVTIELMLREINQFIGNINKSNSKYKPISLLLSGDQSQNGILAGNAKKVFVTAEQKSSFSEEESKYFVLKALTRQADSSNNLEKLKKELLNFNTEDKNVYTSFADYDISLASLTLTDIGINAKDVENRFNLLSYNLRSVNPLIYSMRSDVTQLLSGFAKFKKSEIELQEKAAVEGKTLGVWIGTRNGAQMIIDDLQYDPENKLGFHTVEDTDKFNSAIQDLFDKLSQKTTTQNVMFIQTTGVTLPQAILEFIENSKSKNSEFKEIKNDINRYTYGNIELTIASSNDVQGSEADYVITDVYDISFIHKDMEAKYGFRVDSPSRATPVLNEIYTNMTRAKKYLLIRGQFKNPDNSLRAKVVFSESTPTNIQETAAISNIALFKQIRQNKQEQLQYLLNKINTQTTTEEPTIKPIIEESTEKSIINSVKSEPKKDETLTDVQIEQVDNIIENIEKSINIEIEKLKEQNKSNYVIKVKLNTPDVFSEYEFKYEQNNLVDIKQVNTKIDDIVKEKLIISQTSETDKHVNKIRIDNLLTGKSIYSSGTTNLDENLFNNFIRYITTSTGKPIFLNDQTKIEINSEIVEESIVVPIKEKTDKISLTEYNEDVELITTSSIYKEELESGEFKNAHDFNLVVGMVSNERFLDKDRKVKTDLVREISGIQTNPTISDLDVIDYISLLVMGYSVSKEYTDFILSKLGNAQTEFNLFKNKQSVIRKFIADFNSKTFIQPQLRISTYGQNKNLSVIYTATIANIKLPINFFFTDEFINKETYIKRFLDYKEDQQKPKELRQNISLPLLTKKDESGKMVEYMEYINFLESLKNKLNQSNASVLEYPVSIPLTINDSNTTTGKVILNDDYISRNAFVEDSFSKIKITYPFVFVAPLSSKNGMPIYSEAIGKGTIASLYTFKANDETTRNVYESDSDSKGLHELIVSNRRRGTEGKFNEAGNGLKDHGIIPYKLPNVAIKGLFSSLMKDVQEQYPKEEANQRKEFYKYLSGIYTSSDSFTASRIADLLVVIADFYIYYKNKKKENISDNTILNNYFNVNVDSLTENFGKINGIRKLTNLGIDYMPTISNTNEYVGLVDSENVLDSKNKLSNILPILNQIITTTESKQLSFGDVLLYSMGVYDVVGNVDKNFSKPILENKTIEDFIKERTELSKDISENFTYTKTVSDTIIFNRVSELYTTIERTEEDGDSPALFSNKYPITHFAQQNEDNPDIRYKHVRLNLFDLLNDIKSYSESDNDWSSIKLFENLLSTSKPFNKGLKTNIAFLVPANEKKLFHNVVTFIDTNKRITYLDETVSDDKSNIKTDTVGNLLLHSVKDIALPYLNFPLQTLKDIVDVENLKKQNEQKRIQEQQEKEQQLLTLQKEKEERKLYIENLSNEVINRDKKINDLYSNILNSVQTTESFDITNINEQFKILTSLINERNVVAINYNNLKDVDIEQTLLDSDSFSKEITNSQYTIIFNKTTGNLELIETNSIQELKKESIVSNIVEENIKLQNSAKFIDTNKNELLSNLSTVRGIDSKIIETIKFVLDTTTFEFNLLLVKEFNSDNFIDVYENLLRNYNVSTEIGTLSNFELLNSTVDLNYIYQIVEELFNKIKNNEQLLPATKKIFLAHIKKNFINTQINFNTEQTKKLCTSE